MEKIRVAFSPSQEIPNQLIYTLPERLGKGGMRIEHFPSGLKIFYVEVRPHEPVIFSGETSDWDFGVGFSITGRSRVRSSAYTQTIIVDPGLSGHFMSPGSTTIEEEVLTRHKLKICVCFDTKTLFDMARDDEEAFLPFLKGLDEQIPINSQGKMLPRMSQALSQLIACPYCGKTRALFLESKAMELLAYRLDQLKVNGSLQTEHAQIKRTDVERIHYAAELLARAPADPPDINTLAADVGMSRSKFYQCFKAIYGQSPLDHLRSKRLQVAKELLRQGNLNVTETAYAVGYNSPGYFTRVFNAEFGVPPSQIV